MHGHRWGEGGGRELQLWRCSLWRQAQRRVVGTAVRDFAKEAVVERVSSCWYV